MRHGGAQQVAKLHDEGLGLSALTTLGVFPFLDEFGWRLPHGFKLADLPSQVKAGNGYLTESNQLAVF